MQLIILLKIISFIFTLHVSGSHKPIIKGISSCFFIYNHLVHVVFMLLICVCLWTGLSWWFHCTQKKKKTVRKFSQGILEVCVHNTALSPTEWTLKAHPVTVRTAMKNAGFFPYIACMCYVSFLQQTLFFPCAHSPIGLSNGNIHSFLWGAK